jgi:general secretion pathway protein E
MGIEPFLLSSCLLGVLAQRLVRSLCSNCREAYIPSETELALLEDEVLPEMLYRPKGCATCGNSGYRGRTGIYELLMVDDGMRHLIHDHVAEQDLRRYALEYGMRGLRQDGMRLVAAGVTSLEELLRVTRE